MRASPAGSARAGDARLCALWVLAAVSLLATLAIAGAQTKPNAANPDAALIERGRYLALAGDCQACHTIDQSKQMAGGYAVPTPFGTIYTPNITPDQGTGIGRWSDADFVRAMHQGLGKNGENLYPAFPYDSFTLLSRDDVLAIKAYLISLPPIHNVVPANALGFPFNQRWILAGWKLFNFHDGRFRPDAGKSAQWNRGAYLVQALEHCGTCHSPRNFTMGTENNRKLAGGAVGAWSSYNITPDKVSGIGAWSEHDIQSYLATGIAPGKAWAAGPMGEAVEHSLSQLQPADVQAIVSYLRDQPTIAGGGETAPRFDYGHPAHYEAGLRGANGLSRSANAGSGAELYSANCASCHGDKGTGSADGTFPPLLHNTSVGAPAPNNLVMVIVNGMQRQTAHDDAFMPAFDRLDDNQVATLASYVEGQFGDPTVHVTADQVSAFRKGLGPSPPYLAIGIGIAAGVVLLVVVIFLALRRPWRRRASKQAVQH
ncbi:MAG: cytochrome c [Pseudomonadota bacterium]|nr:cytochrome c [Pseudomonadota bacterium]